MIFLLQDPETGGGLSALFGDTPWIDLVGLAIVFTFFALGIRRGLVWQVTRLIGMLLAVTIARSISPEFVPHFEEVLSLPAKACQGIVWFLVFMATLIVTALVGMVGRRALEAVQLGAMDRMGGGMAGAVTGVIVHCVLLIMLTSLSTAEWASHTLRGSASASMLDNLSRKSHLLLDAQAAERIMEPWGHSYDQERHEEQEKRLERQRQQSIERAKELRAQAAEEERKARQDSSGIR